MKHQGFTIIELMITLAVIGVLAALALPSYNNYLEKSKVSEAFNMIKPFEVGIIECSQDRGGESTIGCSAGVRSVPALQQGSYGAVSNVNDGTIVYTFDSRAGSTLSGGVITFLPEIIAKGSYIWHCQLDGVKVTRQKVTSSIDCQ